MRPSGCTVLIDDVRVTLPARHSLRCETGVQSPNSIGCPVAVRVLERALRHSEWFSDVFAPEWNRAIYWVLRSSAVVTSLLASSPISLSAGGSRCAPFYRSRTVLHRKPVESKPSVFSCWEPGLSCEAPVPRTAPRSTCHPKDIVIWIMWTSRIYKGM